MDPNTVRLITQLVNFVGGALLQNGISLSQLAHLQKERGGVLTEADVQDYADRAQAAINSIPGDG